MNADKTINLFEYLDYRKFLGDFFGYKKSVNKGFSYRLFCRKAGINSPGLVSQVIGGSRNLSKAYLPKFTKALGLDEKEAAFFGSMVAFNQAVTDKDKQALYELMVKALPLRTQRLRRSHLDYFSKWYHVAIRETLSIHKLKGEDCESLAARLAPAITVPQAKAALKLLAGLGLIERDAEGFWKASHVSLVSQGDEAETLLYRAYRKEMILKALEALDRFPAHRQNSSCITMSVSPAGMERVMAYLEDFHRRVLETVQADSGEDRVMQINLQVFPLTRIGNADAL
ncbi:MAG: hypothetical protein JWP91_3681 [Fibrobacteres bacterium]|nr:hypothetical protein [Fibrobacterota bacterium]